MSTLNIPIQLYVDAVEDFRKFYPIASRSECLEEGCGRKPYARGICEMHHKRLERRGLHNPSKNRYKIGPSHASIAAALWSVTDDCILWEHQRTPCGYGRFRLKNINLRVNRFICTATHGEPPLDDMHAAHLCGRSLCANPRHIVWKTAVDNVADKRVHGTQIMGETHHQAILDEKQVREIRAMRGIKTRKQIALMYGVGRSTVDNVIDRKTWGHI